MYIKIIYVVLTDFPGNIILKILHSHHKLPASLCAVRGAKHLIRKASVFLPRRAKCEALSGFPAACLRGLHFASAEGES